MKRRNEYISQLGVSKRFYGDNFIKAGGLFIEIMQYCWL